MLDALAFQAALLLPLAAIAIAILAQKSADIRDFFLIVCGSAHFGVCFWLWFEPAKAATVLGLSADLLDFRFQRSDIKEFLGMAAALAFAAIIAFACIWGRINRDTHPLRTMIAACLAGFGAQASIWAQSSAAIALGPLSLALAAALLLAIRIDNRAILRFAFAVFWASGLGLFSSAILGIAPTDAHFALQPFVFISFAAAGLAPFCFWLFGLQRATGLAYVVFVAPVIFCLAGAHANAAVFFQAELYDFPLQEALSWWSTITALVLAILAWLQRHAGARGAFGAMAGLNVACALIWSGTEPGLRAGLFLAVSSGLSGAVVAMAAGVITGATGKTDIDAFGGLARRLPATIIAWSLGALALSGLAWAGGLWTLRDLGAAFWPTRSALWLMNAAGLALAGFAILAPAWRALVPEDGAPAPPPFRRSHGAPAIAAAITQGLAFIAVILCLITPLIAGNVALAVQALFEPR
ncbi:MAG TPA: hypothetical protein DCZ49_01630 [Hyphomonadaceae bacterium]|nr:hypothetical protein [Hyphomonadaceae bacterium]